MYNYLIKIRIIFVVGILFFCIGNSAFCFDLGDEITATFQKYYKGGRSDSYLQTPYSSVYSKDPFKDSLEDVENMSMQLKIAGAEYVENELKEMNCSISQKKFWSILYYYVPDFKEELVRTVKMGLGDFNSRKFEFDKKKIQEYCRDYYVCENKFTIGEVWKNKDNELNTNELTSNKVNDIETRCKEFFTTNYQIGQDSESKKQSLQTSQVGADKYRNSTVDDSPYDIMTDIGNAGRLLYTDAEQPITPVFYKLPMFSNSKKDLENHEENGSSYSNNSDNNGGEQNGNKGTNGGGNDGGSSVDPLPLPIPRGSEGVSMEGGYDSLIEGLEALTIKEDSLLGNTCEESDEEPDYEPTGSDAIGGDNPSSSSNSIEISDEEFEAVVEYMKGAVDKYSELSEEKKLEMIEKAGDTGRFVGDVTPSQLDKTAQEIKDCWSSCEGLRIDQKASCMLMCTCGEIESPIFDPDETPGLGPIFTIRFCAVPAVDTRFAVGGRKIYSIEEGVKEIYGVVDKLSREGRLGIWTQQYNFLDSTTKKMKVADTVAFTISIEFEDTSNKFLKHSVQYEEKEINNTNEFWLQSTHISNDLENPVSKNRYRLIYNEGEVSNNQLSNGNPEGTIQAQTNLAVDSSSVVNLNADSRASHNVNQSELLDKWLDQQGDQWVNVMAYIQKLTDETITLHSKRDTSK